MPWSDRTMLKNEPSIYLIPSPLSDDVVCGSGGAYEKAKALRKIAAQEKDNGQHPKEGAQWWAKRFKGYYYVCKFYEGVPEYVSWRTPKANQDLAPFTDAAFLELEYPLL